MEKEPGSHNMKKDQSSPEEEGDKGLGQKGRASQILLSIKKAKNAYLASSSLGIPKTKNKNGNDVYYDRKKTISFYLK